MDLKLGTDVASAAEIAAADAVLGVPQEGWRGGVRTEVGLRTGAGGLAVRERRNELLPALHSINDRMGWISPGAVNYLAQRLDVAPAEIFGVASFYGLFSMHERAARQVHVCIDLACQMEGAVVPAGAHSSPCLGLCERAPAALVIETGTAPRQAVIGNATPSQIEVAIAGAWPDPEADVVLATPGLGPNGLGAAGIGAAGMGTAGLGTADPGSRAVPRLPLLSRIGVVDPTSLDSYRSHGGYTALRQAIARGPNAVIREVLDSGLVGRGGAAFPTGRKWEAVSRQPARPHYVVCNADESEPGTFKDRVLMEGDPFALVEAMTIAGFATGAEVGIVYLRGEYPRANDRLKNAVVQARARGLLGTNILGSGLNFDVEIFRGAGAYICGEETAIFNSIEGFRGEPRNKPPFPVESGLFGKPTVVNNVETLLNVLTIVREGAAAYTAVGTASSPGTKLFCVSGGVNFPGVYEVVFGATLRELIDLAGGLRVGRSLQAVLLGGAAGMFVRPDELDLPLTFEDTRSAGVTLGSGVIMVLDDRVDLPRFLQRVAAFFRDESCGQCVPCRVGTVRQEEAVARMITGATAADRELLDDLGQVMKDASICGLGQTAANAIESAIKRLGVFA